jgi:hypothetical protein
MTKRRTFADRDSALVDAPAEAHPAPVVDEAPPMVIPPTLGPGDDDGKDRGTAAPVRGPLGPGESDPNDKVNRNIRMLAQPAPGPGETFVHRRTSVISNEKE